MEYDDSLHKAYAKHASLTSASDGKELSVGILGTANISKKTCHAIKVLQGTLKVRAIGSRSASKAQQFAKEFDIEMAFGSYQEVLDCAQVDIVYIPLPTTQHAEWVRKAALANKHILLEKPCAVNAQELFEMLEVCIEQGVFLMDGTYFMHHDRLQNMAQDLASGRFGNLGPTQCHATFCFRGSEEFFKSDIRVNKDLDPLGALGDLGWYCVRLGLFSFGWTLPSTASAQMNCATHDGVPIDLSANLAWKARHDEPLDVGGLPVVRTLSMSCSFLRNWQQFGAIIGSSATMFLDDFVIPKANEHAYWMDISSIELSHDSTGTKIKETKNTYVTDNCRQEVEMWACFRDCVQATNLGAAISFWPGIALATQLCLDAILESARNGGQQTRVDPNRLMAKFSSLAN